MNKLNLNTLTLVEGGMSGRSCMLLGVGMAIAAGMDILPAAFGLFGVAVANGCFN